MKLPIGKVSLKPCITWDFYCLNKHHEQFQLEKKSLILLYDSSYIIHDVMEGTQGRNAEAGTEREIMKKCCLLACWSLDTHPAFLQQPGSGHYHTNLQFKNVPRS